MAFTEYRCIDGHTCGNPVRLVTSGAPVLEGATMMEKRQHFLKEYDWIRTGLMFEPRGHDMMSGAFLYPSNDPQCDIAVLYIETSGCLPMCGHGTIGVVTMAIEEGIITPARPGHLVLETPAGRIAIDYVQDGDKVTSVTLTNVPAFLHSTELSVDSEWGALKVDVAYGGNFYAIVDPQENFKGLEHHSVAELIVMSPKLRSRLNELFEFVHPIDSNINGLSHILWTGGVLDPQSHGRNAVFYGEKAIDRSPCGTGTSARMAQLHAKGKLAVGESFIHDSIIGSKFTGRVVAETEVGGNKAIIPSITGWARKTGYNHIILDDDDPFVKGFTVK